MSDPKPPLPPLPVAPLELEPLDVASLMGDPFDPGADPAGESEGDATEVFSVESLHPPPAQTGTPSTPPLEIDDELDAVLVALSEPPPAATDAEPDALSIEPVLEAEMVDDPVETAIPEATHTADEVAASVGVADEPLDAVEVAEAAEELSADEIDTGVGPALAEEFEGETELVFDEGEEEIVMVEEPQPAASPDRGAMLAATVTSRSRRVDVGELAFAADARAEVTARIALLTEQADYAATAEESAELLALAADLADVGDSDRARARALAEESLARDPACLLASRLMRRFALADGDFVLALDRAETELMLPMSDPERGQLQALIGELAVPTDAARAQAAWTDVALTPGPWGALYGLLGAAAVRDGAAIGAALATLSGRTGGVLSAAVNVARARLAEGAAETDAALQAIREAVARDNTDAGAWLAMARIGLSRASGAVFRDALRGLRAAGGDGHGATAAAGLLMAIDGVLGESPNETLDDRGVAGWLAAHAVRDPDAQAKVARGLNDDDPPAWAALAGDGESDVGRFHAVRRAGAAHPEWAALAAAFVGGATREREAGLLGRAAAVSEREAHCAESAGQWRVALGLGASSRGVAGVLWPREGTASGWHRVGWIVRRAKEGATSEALAMLDDADGVLMSQGAAVFAARKASWLRGDPSSRAKALREEARQASDPERIAGHFLMASAFSAGVQESDGASDATGLAAAAPNDLVAAEAVGLWGLRGVGDAETSAALLDRAAQGLKGIASRVASVRAAMRRGGDDSGLVAGTVWKLWQQSEHDAALGVLVLRASAGSLERAVSVVRAHADRAQGLAGAAGVAVWLQLVAFCELLGRHAEAVQAVARARTLALTDPSLAQTEERLWLKAGMFAEVAERAFDQARAAEKDEQRVAAYERLAELDRSFRNDVASSVLSYQAILEIAPGHMGSLRTLERYFLENGRFEELLGIYDRLVRYAEDPEDVVAMAHMASRLATIQADGDAAAGVAYLQLAMDRHATDRRSLMALDAETRRTGDLSRFAHVHQLAMELAVDPMEKATHGVRAGEAMAALGQRHESLKLYQSAVSAVPTHPVALSGLAREQDVASDAAGSAETMEALARVLREPAQAVACYLRAASVWQSLHERDRSLAATLAVLELDPVNVEAFDRAIGLLRDADDRAGELGLIENRTQNTEDPAFTPLLVRAAELSEELGDRARAVGHWRAVFRLMPDHDGALRSLARLSVELEEWPSAADAMIRLARLVPDRLERAELFFSLGDLYDVNLPDPRRAEAAWKRVVQLVPDDDRTLARLADLYARTGDARQEAETLETRITLAVTAGERRALLLRLGDVLERGVQDVPNARNAFERARREGPTDLVMLRAYAAFYQRQGDDVGREMLLDRAANEVRPALDANPTDTAKLTLLADILELRGRKDGARLVGAVSVALNATTERLRELAPLGSVPGAGAGTLTPEVVELLSPPALSAALRELLVQTAAVFDKLLPFDPKPMRAEALGARPHPLRAEAERWAKLYGLGAVEIYLAGTVPGGCLPISRSPCVVVVPATAMATPATRFAMARAMLLNALSLAPAMRLSPRELSLGMNAILRLFEPMYRHNEVDLAQLEDLARKVARIIPRERHAELEPHAFEVIESRGSDGDAIQAGALELGNRLTLLATGDVVGAIAALSPEAVAPAVAFQQVVQVSRIVRVALSERFLEGRHLAGADKL